MKTLLSVIILFISMMAYGQMGCTDPLAENYDENAVNNDGSCTYGFTLDRPFELYQLDTPIIESSGLLYTSEGLWTHNDSGNDPILYLLDSSSYDIKRRVFISNAKNKDWEDLTSDDTYFYIGDFGNNKGSRKKLGIYRILRSDIAVSDTVSADFIRFSYEDQIDFTPSNKDTDFDCEAFFVLNDQFHLFTKNWKNRKTKHYSFSNSLGKHTAILHDSFDVKGLITAADIADDGVIALLGYEDKATGEAFQWLLFDYKEMDFFTGNKRRISLGAIFERGQVEGMTFSHNGEGFISSEKVSIIPPKMARFTSLEWTEYMVASNNVYINPQLLSVFPNPFQDSIHLILDDTANGLDIQVQLINVFGQTVFQDFIKGNGNQFELSLPNIPAGTYFLNVLVDGYKDVIVLVKS